MSIKNLYSELEKPYQNINVNSSTNHNYQPNLYTGSFLTGSEITANSRSGTVLFTDSPPLSPNDSLYIDINYAGFTLNTHTIIVSAYHDSQTAVISMFAYVRSISDNLVEIGLQNTSELVITAGHNIGFTFFVLGG